MAVIPEDPATKTFEDWYISLAENERTGCLEFTGLSRFADHLWHQYQNYKREMDARVGNYYKLELLADNQVISPKPDLPNISSGETAGLIRRTARSLVQNTPNVTVISKWDDDKPEGVFARHILLTKIIGAELYSNDMQQNLFASTKTALTLGFDCIVPLLLQDAMGSWYIKYDVIHYRDVFPEPGAKDVRDAMDVFVRRYLTVGEVRNIIRNQVPGWHLPALRRLLETRPPAREMQSVSQQDRKHHVVPDGYEIITWYNSFGEPFLTFSATQRTLLRIEKNKHPNKVHPVFFLVLEKDELQPLGRSQVELILGRQEFQDLMLNGAMKLWYRNINPSILGFGTVNAVPNLSPGKFTEISNPNARIETFEVNTQTLLQFGAITQQNLGSMVSLMGTADMQMSQQSNSGMSATPQGVEAQTELVDVTTNNYQKAIERFFSHYCSYALTMYFHELAGTETVELTADSRKQLLNAGFDPARFNEDGTVEINFSDLATEYFVRCVPGSLVELEDEKQLRILNQLFVPLSQVMPALAATGDPQVLANAAATIAFLVERQIELSGSTHSRELKQILREGRTPQVQQEQEKGAALEDIIGVLNEDTLRGVEVLAAGQQEMREQLNLMAQTQSLLLEKLGVVPPGSTPEAAISPAS